MLTAAERHPFLFVKGDLDRSEIRSRMGSVTEGLCFRSAATTPIDRPRSNIQHIGIALRNDELISHVVPSLFLTPVARVTEPIDSGVAALELR